MSSILRLAALVLLVVGTVGTVVSAVDEEKILLRHLVPIDSDR